MTRYRFYAIVGIVLVLADIWVGSYLMHIYYDMNSLWPSLPILFTMILFALGAMMLAIEGISNWNVTRP